jgi:thiamine biosynthesis lipoprotein
MSRTAGVYDINPDAALLAWYRQLYDVTDGLVTPLIGQSLVDAGYDADYSLTPHGSISTAPGWDSVLSFAGDALTVKQPVLIDVGAAGKGYAVDAVARFLSGDFCVDASGDMFIGGTPQRIGLEDPHDPTKIIGIATVANQSICGSSINKRAWADWNHIINPKTARPVSDVIATWVIADTAMHADGLATALFFVSPELLQNLMPFDYCIVHSDGTIRISNSSNIELMREGK